MMNGQIVPAMTGMEIVVAGMVVLLAVLSADAYAFLRAAIDLSMPFRRVSRASSGKPALRAVGQAPVRTGWVLAASPLRRPD